VTSSHPITEDDLHGFVDHLLDSARRSEVQTYLDAHPEIARVLQPSVANARRSAPPPHRSRTNRFRRGSMCAT